MFSGLLRPVYAVDSAVIGSKSPVLNKVESDSFVEPSCPRVRSKGIDEDARDGGIGETELEHELHHDGSKAAAEVTRRSYPDIDGPQVRLDVTPVVGLFALRVDDLNDPNRTAIDFSDEVPLPIDIAREFCVPVDRVIIAGGRDYVRLPIPCLKQFRIGKHGRSQIHHSPTLPA